MAELEDFWGTLATSPVDPDLVLTGGVELQRSTDGGQSFVRANAWGHYYGDPETRLHADVRGIDALEDPDGEGALVFVSTDGGTYLSRDGGASFRNLCLEGLGVGQVYSTLTSKRDRDLILAGTQDQGYQRGRREPARVSGPSTGFDQLLSGDYGYLTSSDGTHGLVYCTYPGFVLVQEGETHPNLLYPWVDFPAGSQHAWMPPVVADPTDPEAFFFLADRLYRYARRRGPYWAYRRHSGQDFTAAGGRYLTALAFAPGDPSRVYAANDAGAAWTSDDRGRTWRRTELTGGRYLRPTSIDVARNDRDRCVVGGSGYGGPGVLATDDGGRTWRALERGLPRTLVLDVGWANDGSGDVYAATECGPYRWSAEERRWRGLMGVEAPATTYWSLEVLPDEGLVRFGTYGRGIWDYRRRDARPASAEAR